MNGRRSRILTLALVFTGALGLSAASAAPDRKPPTTPKNFRVTAKTLSSVSLAWSPSTDNSGNFTYSLAVNSVGTLTLPRTATSFTWTSDIYPGIFPGRSYTFVISAVDAVGNRSSWASASATIPPDTTPPTAGPVASVSEAGSNYVDLAWTAAQDDGPIRFYEVWVNGSRYGTTTNRSLTVRFLQPQTTYAFQVRAWDYGSNVSPFSNAVTVTTPPPNPDDTTPPTVPANLGAWTFGSGDGETELSWSESTDDFDDPEDIRYDVYVNGVWTDVYFGSGRRNTVYLTVGAENLIEVIASDTAGNESEPATVTVDLR